METTFHKGQRVWSPLFGYGEVTEIGNYLIVEKKPSKSATFNLDGTFLINSPAPTLFPADKIPDFYKPYAQDERIGKYGYFWDSHHEKNRVAVYGKLSAIIENDDRPYAVYTNYYSNFSTEIPEHCK